MAKNAGFFKGEKKKPKQNKDKVISGLSQATAPTFVMPELISKKKKNSF